MTQGGSSVDVLTLQADFDAKVREFGFASRAAQDALDDLYRALIDRDELAAALSLMLECLGLSRDALGEYHYESERIELRIANIYYRQHRFADARPLNLKLVDAWLPKFGLGSENCDGAIRNCELTLLALDDRKALAVLWEHVVEFCRQTYGDDQRTLTAMSRLAAMRTEAGDYDKASTIHSTMLSQAERLALGPRQIVDAKRLIGLDALRNQEWDRAFRILEVIQAQATSELPADDSLRLWFESLPRRLPRTPYQWERFRANWIGLTGSRRGKKIIADFMDIIEGFPEPQFDFSGAPVPMEGRP